MYMTGFADEAATGLDGQIKAIQTLGWKNIEARNIDGVNLHDLSDEAFDRAAAALEEAGITVNSFGSAIANWAKDLSKPIDEDIEQSRRAIRRMKRLGTRLIRIMSYPVLKDRAPEDQMEAERFRRVRQITRLFLDEGLQPVHENCMNYGGMGWPFTLRLLENVPGLKLVFDTGNPVFTPDYTQPEPRPRQSAWEFYTHVREHVVYVHIKDGVWNEKEQKTIYSWCGEGDGDVKRICADLLKHGYDGGFSIEPHLGSVFHDPDSGQSPEHVRFETFVEYGRRMEKILEEARTAS